ncbi:hypothetical protein HO133_004541 [Letharia lupina]|uniref:LisH domain-containing protein n=1 Tax=Letharia lupina TaxID=560253 RepID=A0A8H6FKJ4_9LECA|nr:uncharacterized protein HO133_004541 [Letharia lupina]KAF6230202.1 hypothetical protein HO133_004541 [Letharia lupina]
MPAPDSPPIIVARFLRANNYNDTLSAFILEAGLSRDAGVIEKGDLTIEKILEEKKVFDLTLRFEKPGLEDGEKWTLPAPSNPNHISTLPSATNILHVSVQKFHGEKPFQLLLASTADRNLHLITTDTTFSIYKSLPYLQDSPILSCISFGEQGLKTITTGMSGQVVLYDHEMARVCDERKDHKKYVVKVATWDKIVVTAGWDNKVFLYHASGDFSSLGSPVAATTLSTNPETITFVDHPDSDRPILLITRRDSTSLYYYSLELKLLGSQNLAPHSNSWVTFTPASVEVCPKDSTLLAVATSAVPHMKVIIVKLLLPSLTQSPSNLASPVTQAAQTRNNLAIQDREEAAIQVHVSTMAPQTPYSTPQVVWRPNGAGVFVNGDDGVIRGLEAKTGKIVATLQGGHELGSKIRSIWCGLIEVEERRKEWLVTGGFDHRLVVWD